MPLGDGIRRDVAKISQVERDLFISALIALDTTKAYPDKVSYFDKQEQIHKSAHAAGQNVHHGPAFLPWHRELCNRLERLLREVDPRLSLHYWDWTTDPRVPSADRVALFTQSFMGNPNNSAGTPLGNFESTEITGDPLVGEPGDSIHDHIWRFVNEGNPGAPGIASDQDIVTAGDSLPTGFQFPMFRIVLESAHDTAHGYIGGTIGRQHFSFHDPFVFLIHSNVDRLWAMWQLAPGKAWRLDPNQVYGYESTAPSITGNLEPWSGGTRLIPWDPSVRGNQIEVKTSKHPSVVTPPLYTRKDMGPSLRVSCATNQQGDLHVLASDQSNGLWHTIRMADGTWPFAFGDVQAATRLIGSNEGIGPTPFVACATNQQGDLHVLAIDQNNGLWHTIRMADGSWPFAFVDVQAATRLIGHNPGIGPTPSVACSVNSQGDLHVNAIDLNGVLWHTIRMANGSWPFAFEDVQSAIR
jgi:hypothetical protein